MFKKYRSYFPSPFPEKSLQSTHPEICNDWDFEKNYPLRPENFTYGSAYKIWWSCKNGHSYQKKIIHKARHINCPYCTGRKSLNLDLFSY